VETCRQFHQCSTYSFYAHRPQIHKKDSQVRCLALLGPTGVKAVRRTLMKLTPDVNFINILHAHFFPIFWCQKLQSWVLGLKFFDAKISAKKVCLKCWWNWHLCYRNTVLTITKNTKYLEHGEVRYLLKFYVQLIFNIRNINILIFQVLKTKLFKNEILFFLLTVYSFLSLIGIKPSIWKKKVSEGSILTIKDYTF